MSQFDCYTTSEYVDTLRSFLGLKKQNFLHDNGFVEENSPRRRGRLPKYAQEPIKVLEQKVNARAALAESKHSTLAERISIARDYLGITDTEIARSMSLSPETVRRWAESISKPSLVDVNRLAEILKVPSIWLEQGGEDCFLANSQIGVRVGDEAVAIKNELKEYLWETLEEMPRDADLVYIQAYLEWSVFNNPKLTCLSRRAGGRWQVIEKNHFIHDSVVFAPWIPIREHGLGKRMWSDEVEEIINEELNRNGSVYSAWNSLAKRCEEKGLTPADYPRKISLYKRLEHERERVERFGINMNEVIKESIFRIYRIK